MATQDMCFVIMPISDPDGYVKGHFKHVFDDIIAPACDKAGFKGLRGDQVKQSNLIHLDILQRLLDAPMAVCDLSSRNPNVLFELALRQAFDKPVALIQEVGTPPVFDISPFRYAEYRKERTYHEVLEDQAQITTAIKDTYEAHKTGRGVNSIVKLLGLSKPASLPKIDATEASADIQQLILAELNQLREEVRGTRRDSVLARRNLREHSFEDLEIVRHLLKETEMRVMNVSDPTDINRAASMLAECRNRWHRIMENMQSLPLTERDVVGKYDMHLDMLEKELTRASERLLEKRKK